MTKQVQSLYRYSPQDYEETVRKLFRQTPKLSHEKALYIYDLNVLDNRLTHLVETYPEGTIHAAAIKTCSLPHVLKHIVKKGLGLEAASFEEVELAARSGCPNNKIVFDSPAKTQHEIDACNTRFPGLYLNVNTLTELERTRNADALQIGVRINPLIDVKSPGIFNVSNRGSKFGIPITRKDDIIKAIMESGNVSGLHIHAGSEIKDIANHIEAIGIVYDLAEEINAIQADKIKFIDIGGGFPANMKQGNQQGLEKIANQVNVRCPQLFTDYQVITEYGRFIHAHNAFAISRVEYIIDDYQPNILITHLGADLFVREIYSSNAPHHSIHVLTNDGKLKPKTTTNYDIAGPLCFSGDFLGRELLLATVNVNDYILIADCGANTISMWSQHCSREKIKVVYYQEMNNI